MLLNMIPITSVKIPMKIADNLPAKYKQIE